MKITLFLLLGIVVFAMACTKGNNGGTSTSAIKGVWELRATRNGNILPATYPAGNGNFLVFGNVTFAQYGAGATIDTGSYATSTNTAYQFTLSSILNNSPFIKHVSLVKDTLLLYPGQPDISTGFYVRVGQ